jgi:hypothetical protein
MKHLKKFNEALSTECQTPEMVYDISINESDIEIKLNLPFNLDLDESEAELLEKNIHNSLELVMSKYFK